MSIGRLHKLWVGSLCILPIDKCVLFRLHNYGTVGELNLCAFCLLTNLSRLWYNSGGLRPAASAATGNLIFLTLWLRAWGSSPHSLPFVILRLGYQLNHVDLFQLILCAEPCYSSGQIVSLNDCNSTVCYDVIMFHGFVPLS